MQEFRLRRLSSYTKEAIIAELRRVASETDATPLTIAEFELRSRVKIAAIRRRFGSWRDALFAAGVGYRFSGQYGANTPERLERLTYAEILSELRRLPKLTGRDTAHVKDIDLFCSFSSAWLRNRYGRPPREVMSEADLCVSEFGKRYSNEECYENLLNVWTHYGRPPKFQEMNLAPSMVKGNAYLRFGSWLMALEAFVERVNADSSHERSAAAQKPREKIEPNATLKTEDKIFAEKIRDIRLGLRFEILKRDNFKCVLCGNSPAVDPTCRLHVDHVLPFSKGGKAVPSNLRSLCERCNLGRSNSYVD